MFSHKRIEYLDRSKIVTIVGDGSISTGKVGEGRMIPLVIVDATMRPDLVELVRLHEKGPQGDVKLQWAFTAASLENIALICRFLRPVAAECAIIFDIDEHGILVDQALAKKALYFQPGVPGDRLKNTWNNPRIIMEVPEMKFRPIWEKTYFKSVVRQLRNRGLGRSQAKRSAEGVIRQLRGLGEIRMPTP